jgi:hypothetical protein
MPDKPISYHKITIELSDETIAYLEVLGRDSHLFDHCDLRQRQGASVPYVLQHLAQSAADGLRRPGAWEAQWVVQAFGNDWTGSLEPIPGLPYLNLRPKAKAGQ